MPISKNDQKYVVFSNGLVLPDFEISEVAAKLSTLYKIPADKISLRLLSGEVRKIRSFDEAADAERLVAKLANMGLNCYILSPDLEEQTDVDEHSANVTSQSNTTDEPNENSTDLRSADIDSKPLATPTIVESENTPQGVEAKPKSNLKWLLPLLLILGLLVGLYYYFSKWVTPEVPNSVAKVEAALFMSQKPSALMHGDLIQLRRLLSLTDDVELEKKSASALSSLPLLNSGGDTDALLEATNYVTLSATFSGNDTPVSNWLTVLQGDYASLNLDKELSKMYVIEGRNNGVITLKHKPQTSLTNSDVECPADEGETKTKSKTPIYAHLSATQIALSSSQDGLSSFISTYSNNNELDQLQLREWQDYRAESLFAMSLFDKQLLQKDFIARAASSALFGDSPYKSIGARASVLPIKQALELSFDADMNDKAIAKELASKVKEGIDELNTANKESYPAVIDLLSRFDVDSDHALHITLSLDKTLANELEGLVSNFFSMMFDSSMSQSEPSADGVPEEVLETNTWDYALNKKMLGESKPPVDQFTKFQPIAINGSVAVYLDSIGVKPISPFDPEQGNALQITLESKRAAPFGNAYFGWSDSGIKQSLSITEVLGKDGNSLLVDERCKKSSFSQDLNHQASDSTNYVNEVIATSKTVRLIDSATVEKISTIKGRYVLEVAVDIIVQDVTLENPLVEWPAGSLQLIEINKGSVSYTLTGDEAHLLEVRGLNKNGQALSSNSSFSSGKRHTKKFEGEVASVKLFIAGKLERQEFEFNINNIIPKPTIDGNTSSFTKTVGEPILFNTADVLKFSKSIALKNLNAKETKEISRNMSWQSHSLDASQEHELGHTLTKSGAIFFKHNDKSNWGHELTGLVLLPFDKSLQFVNGLATLNLRLDGEAVTPVDLSISRKTINGEPVPSFSVGSLDYNIGTFSIRFEEQRAKIREIEGVLEYRLPTKVTTKTVDLMSQSSEPSGLSFIAYDFGSYGRVTYQLNDELAKAFFIKLSTEDGLESVGEIDIENGVSTAVFDQVANLKNMKFYFIEKAHSMAEEFTFTPVYK